MSGDELKGILKNHKVKITDLASMLGMSQPNLSAALNAADIKTGLIEKIASVTNIPIPELFGVSSHSVNNISSHATGNGQASVNIGSGNTYASDTESIDRLQERIQYLEQIIAEKERLITILMKN